MNSIFMAQNISDSSLELLSQDYNSLSYPYLQVSSNGNGEVFSTENTGGLLSLTVSSSGILDDIAVRITNNPYLGVHSDSSYIYSTNGGEGLFLYESDGSANVTYLDRDDQGGYYNDVCGDGTYVYVADGTDGILSYEVSSDLLVYIDTSAELGGNSYIAITTDGDYIYVASDGSGIYSYSVDGSGNLTNVDSDTAGDTGTGIFAIGGFVFVTDAVDGLRCYSVDGSGNLTFEDSDRQGTQQYTSVWADDDYIYVAGDSLLVYSVDGSGNLTYITNNNDLTGNYYYVSGDDKFVYVSFYTNIGVACYSKYKGY